MGIIITNKKYEGSGPILKIKKGTLESIGLAENEPLENIGLEVAKSNPTLTVPNIYANLSIGPFIRTSLLKENNLNTGVVSLSANGITCDQLIEWNFVSNNFEDPSFQDTENSIIPGPFTTIQVGDSTDLDLGLKNGIIRVKADNEMALSETLQFDLFVKNILTKNNHKYYIYCELKIVHSGSNDLIKFTISGGKDTSTVYQFLTSNDESKLNAFYNHDYDYNSSSINFKVNLTSLEDYIELTKPVLIDLTEIFGLGNEPTSLDWCKQNILPINELQILIKEGGILL